MDISEEEIINESISEIKQALGIIKSEITAIDEKGNSKKQTLLDPIDELVRCSILFTQRSYLDFFRKIVNFIYEKLDKETSEQDFFFHIPHIRTLIEIYSYLLYFCFQNEKRQMELIISKNFYTLAKVDSSFPTSEIQQEYTKTHEHYKPYMDREKLVFPKNATDFSKKWLDKSGYDNPSVEQMLKTEWIKTSAPQIYTASPKKADKNSYYNIYRHFSNYVHGNVLHKESYGNEKLWIISETLNLSVVMIELINTKILDNSRRKEVLEWIKRVAKNSPNFLRLWALRRDKINSERNQF